MQKVPDSAPEPAPPQTPKPSSQDLLFAQLRVARFLILNQIDAKGIRAAIVARLMRDDAAPLSEDVSEWSIYTMLENKLLRLVLKSRSPSPHSGYSYFGPPGLPPPVFHVFVQFSDQVITPTENLWPWLQSQDTQIVSELSEREKEILKALLLLNALGKRSRVSRQKAARRADPASKASTFNHAIAMLVKRGFVASQKGPTGGIWLTSEGRKNTK